MDKLIVLPGGTTVIYTPYEDRLPAWRELLLPEERSDGKKKVIVVSGEVEVIDLRQVEPLP